MSWAIRRKILYAVGVALFFLIVVGGPIAYSILKTPPTCTDGVQNQGETAVDRGGPCPLLDSRAQQAPIVMWARSFRVRDGSYNAIAYVQNSNTGAAAQHLPYRFRLYDAENILVADREGALYLAPNAITPVFEGNIPAGNRIAARAFFDFLDSPVWERARDDTAKAFTISNKSSSNETTAPLVSATLTNTSTHIAYNLVVTAVVFDPSGNAIAASKTVVPRIAAGEQKQLVFTWPDPFQGTVGRIDIVPVLPPPAS